MRSAVAVVLAGFRHLSGIPVPIFTNKGRSRGRPSNISLGYKVPHTPGSGNIFRPLMEGLGPIIAGSYHLAILVLVLRMGSLRTAFILPAMVDLKLLGV